MLRRVGHDTRPKTPANPTTAAMQVYGAPATPDNPRGTRAGLVLLYAPSFDQFAPAYLLSERDLIIGRDPSSGICIPEAAVSRQHARVHFRDGRWWIKDLGGRNGTLVGGQFVHERALEAGDEIRVGDAIFKFVDAGAESYARYRIDGSRLEGALPVSGSRIVGGYQVARLGSALERVSRTEISVILLGESGTGKEVFASQLHDWSGRRGAFQALNCAAIPATLLESELFGHKRGAFSGADRDKPGLVRAAEGGTLFLDEIGDMPQEAQAKLLRVLQSREIIPVGATAPEHVDVRVVCATHRDLNQLQTEGRFRGDLYARLNEYSLRLPPLRERKEDIYALCRAFFTRQGRPEIVPNFAFMTGLLHYHWPFNVRELEAAIKRGVALCEGQELDASHLPDVVKEVMQGYAIRGGEGPTSHFPPASAAASTARAIDPHLVSQGEAPGPGRRPSSATPSEQELRTALAQHHGNVAAVGRQFGKERMQVHRWMKRYGINIDEYR